MKLLWITNYLFPEISDALGIKYKFPNGWTYSAARLLLQTGDYEMAIASIGPVKELVKKETGGFTFYVLPNTRLSGRLYDKFIGDYFANVNDDFQPDVVHIYGTEFPHSYAYLKRNSANVVISIQGLVGAYAKYFLGGLTRSEVYQNLTFHDIVRKDLIQQQKDFVVKGEKENECLRMVNYLEGRTSWDKAISISVNPGAKYFHCPRILRDVFYTSRKWDYSQCKKHTIFISQAHYPIKGAHIVFKALPLIKRKFPDAKIIVGGVGLTEQKTFKQKLYYGGYGKYLTRLVKSLGIADSISYTGPLSAEQMCEQYLMSHVYICPSSIENSPNSVAEAQILGTPLIASYTGGTPDMITHGVDGYLYRFEEVEMLADLVCNIFSMEDYHTLSCNEVATSEKRHDRNAIINELQSIYKTIYKDLNEQ